MRKYMLAFWILFVAGCGQPAEDAAEQPMAEEPAAEAPAEPAADEPMSAADKLDAVLEAQPEAVKDRYTYRNPRETMMFFGIEPGMTLVEALPGGGWYSKILIPYLGPDGKLIGADYAIDMYRNFPFATEEFLEQKQTWTTDWPETARSWHGEGSAGIDAFHFGSLPEEWHGTADAVLFVRAMHNLARFEEDGGYLTAAIRDAYDVLKPGGTVGIVQHEAREDMPDDWANGQNGYLKREFVIARMEAAGFEFVDSSDVNQNPADRPTTDDAVWRLPPSLQGAEEDSERYDEMTAIGESNRMTLKFRKPTM